MAFRLAQRQAGSRSHVGAVLIEIATVAYLIFLIICAGNMFISWAEKCSRKQLPSRRHSGPVLEVKDRSPYRARRQQVLRRRDHILRLGLRERLAGMHQPAPPAERDDLRTLLKGAAIGVGASGIVFFAVGGNVDHPHRLIVVLLLLVVAAVAGWAAATG